MKKLILAGLLCSCIHVFAAPEPVLEVKVDLAKWLAPTGTTNEVAMALAAMGVTKANVGLYVDDGKLIPVGKVQTAMPLVAATFLSNTNLSGMTVVSPMEFAWTPDKQMQDILALFSLKEPRIRIEGNAILLFGETAGMALANKLDAGMGLEDLGRASFQFGRLIEPLISSAKNFIDSQPDGMGKAIMGGMVNSMAKELRAIKSPPSISLQVVPDGAAGRKMVLGLDFADEQVAADTKAFFADVSDAWKKPGITSQQLGLSGLAESAYFQGMELKGASLLFSYAWPAKEDMQMLASIGKPLGSCLSGMTRSRSYPLNPEKLQAKPEIGGLEQFDPAQFEQDVRQALVFNHQWKKRVSLELDWFNPPAADLVTATVTNVSVLTAEGEDIANPERPGSFMPDSRTRGARISLNTLEDKPEPVKASFTLSFSLPSEVQAITLTPQGPVYEKAGGGLCLMGISNSVVTIRSKNMDLSDARIDALNRDGECLARRGYSRSSSTYRGEFSGRPASVEVLLVGDTTSCSVKIADFPVTKESKFKMPRMPTNAVPVRYTLEPVDEFVSPDLAVIAASEMTVSTNRGSRGEWWLQFPAPGNVKVDNLAIRSYLAGVEQLVHIGQDAGFSRSGANYIWKLGDTNNLKQASAVFGDLDVRLCDEVGTFTSVLTTNPVPLIEGKELPAVRVDHNVVWFDYEDDFQVLTVQAFDQAGRRLKKANRTSSGNNRRGLHFWGQPAKVKATCSLGTANVMVPFSIELKEGGLAKVADARKKADQFEELLAELIGIQKETGRFGNLLAASYYSSDHAGNPTAKIPLEVANADPVGAEIFGYQPKPYKGYFLKKVPSDYEAKREHKPVRYKWSGGSFQADSYTGQLLAVPAEKGQPAVLVTWSKDAFVNYGDVSGFEVAPSSNRNLEKEGWMKVK